MMLLIECIILCAIFSIVILVPLYKNPLEMIASYPTKIRKRVEELEQYKDTINQYKTKHIERKIVGVLIIIFILSGLAWITNDRTFIDAFKHIFILLFTVNLFDFFIRDICFFCHSKRVIIKGTEDMIKEYKDPTQHILGLVVGTFISLSCAGICGLTVELLSKV